MAILSMQHPEAPEMPSSPDATGPDKAPSRPVVRTRQFEKVTRAKDPVVPMVQAGVDAGVQTSVQTRVEAGVEAGVETGVQTGPDRFAELSKVFHRFPKGTSGQVKMATLDRLGQQKTRRTDVVWPQELNRTVVASMRVPPGGLVGEEPFVQHFAEAMQEDEEDTFMSRIRHFMTCAARLDRPEPIPEPGQKADDGELARLKAPPFSQ